MLPHINLRRATATALVTGGALLAASVPAHATAPTRTVELRKVDLVLTSCGSFMLEVKADVEREYIVYYDEDGVPVRDVLVRRSDGAFVNSVTGKSVDISGIWRVTRTYTNGVLDGTAIQTGRTYTITVPGGGIIFHQSGRGIQEDGVTVFEAGAHDFDQRNFGALCDYLAT